MKKLEKGFTLIELMIVVAIIGILAAVAAPRFGTQIQRARDAKGLAVISTWRSATNLYYSEELKHAEKIGDLLGNVDTGTVNATFDVNTDDTPVTSGSGIVYVLVGKGEETAETNNKHGVRFQVGTGDKEGEIEILTTQPNTADVEWNKL